MPPTACYRSVKSEMTSNPIHLVPKSTECYRDVNLILCPINVSGIPHPLLSVSLPHSHWGGGGGGGVHGRSCRPIRDASAAAEWRETGGLFANLAVNQLGCCRWDNKVHKIQIRKNKTIITTLCLFTACLLTLSVPALHLQLCHQNPALFS